MSIIVKGMKMPEHCGYCRFRYDGICHALQKTQYAKDECPLVPVPPHGRLIDADKFSEKLWNAIKSECNQSWASALKEIDFWLENEEAIIDAEEGE